jgi:hypothetical protein
VSPTTVDALYLIIANNMVASPAQGVVEDLVLETQVDTKRFCNSLLKNVHVLPWFPPDVDPAHYGIRIDTRKIPQRTPLWFKLRGTVTGSKAYALLGYFVPPPPAPYNFYKGSSSSFSAFARSAMRLGTVSEDAAMIAYLHAFPDRSFYELGWCPLPAPAPLGWGASPDGLLEDPSMISWDMVPADVASHYSEEERVANPGGLAKGACEFKTSRTKTCMEAYFYPQVYMEMMALNVYWCDLVRYRPGAEARVYRIYRHKPTEELLMRLWKRAIDNATRLQEIVYDGSGGEYTRVRIMFDQMAKEHQPYRVIPVDEALQAKLQAYEEEKKRLGSPVALAPREEEIKEDDEGWDTIFRVTAQIENALKRQRSASVETKETLKQLTLEQVENYARKLKKFF